MIDREARDSLGNALAQFLDRAITSDEFDKRYRSLQTDVEILAAYRALGNPGYHACGTCRMGSFNDAVVDSELRVKGVAGLRVVDGSVMPAMVSANTNGPIMALAWRAAQRIKATGL